MVAVIDSTGMDLGKHAYSQMKDFGVNPEVIKTEALNAPREVSRGDHQHFLLILDSSERFVEQVIGKILDLEEEVNVDKVILEKKNEGQEVFEKRAQRKTMEKAEKLAEKTG